MPSKIHPKLRVAVFQAAPEFLDLWLLLPVAGAAVRVSQNNEAAGDPDRSGAAAPVLAA